MYRFLHRSSLILLLLFCSAALSTQTLANTDSSEELVSTLGYEYWGVPKEKVDVPRFSAKIAKILTDDPADQQLVIEQFKIWFDDQFGMVLETENASEDDIRATSLGDRKIGNISGPVIVVEDRFGGDRKPVGNFYQLELSQGADGSLVVDAFYGKSGLSYALWQAFNLYFANNASKEMLQRLVFSGVVTDQDFEIFSGIYELRRRDEWDAALSGFDKLSPTVRQDKLILALRFEMIEESFSLDDGLPNSFAADRYRRENNIKPDPVKSSPQNYRIQQIHRQKAMALLEKVYPNELFTAATGLPTYYTNDDYQKQHNALSIIEKNVGQTESILRFQAESLSKLGDYKAAEHYGRLRVEQYPDEYSYAAFVKILTSTKNYKEALKYATLLYEEDPSVDTAASIAVIHSLSGNKKQAKYYRQVMIDEYDVKEHEADMLLSLSTGDYKKFVRLLDVFAKEGGELTPEDMEGEELFADFMKSKEFAKWAKKFE